MIFGITIHYFSLCVKGFLATALEKKCENIDNIHIPKNMTTIQACRNDDIYVILAAPGIFLFYPVPPFRALAVVFILSSVSNIKL